MSVPRRPPGGRRWTVMFAGQDWWYHNRAHSDMQLGQQLAASRPVLLINSIGTRMPVPGRSTQVRQRLARKLRSIARFVRRPVDTLPGFYVYSPLSLPIYDKPWGRRLNAVVLLVQLGFVQWWLRIDRPDVVVTPPTAWDVARRMRRRTLTFNRSDKHSAWTEVDQAFVETCEQALLRSADLILYVSHALMDEDAELTGDRALFLDHGVDAGLFTPVGPVAAELDDLPRPRIGYFGALRDVTNDIALIERVADEVTASIVLVGPSTVDMTGLSTRANVRWFGPRPHEEIPAFGRGFDVAIMPWLDNDWIRSCNPVKLKEYLALGLHVVTTDFPEVRRYADVVDIATSRDEFVALCARAVREIGTERARADVTADSWERRGVQLAAAIDAAGQADAVG